MFIKGFTASGTVICECGCTSFSLSPQIENKDRWKESWYYDIICNDCTSTIRITIGADNNVRK